MTCVHCGLCLNACPTYLETGSEADSPRGRIVLMRGLHEGSLSPSDADVVEHLDRCLGCRACETACPSSVPYGSLIEVARDRINQAGVRPASTSLSRRGLLATMTNPAAMTLAMRASKAATGGGIPSIATRLLSGDKDALGLSVAMPDVIAPPLPPAFTPAIGQKRYRVGVLTGCVMRVLYGDINDDTVRVLAANGCEVLVNRRQGCCGALHLHNGYGEDARALARRLIDAFTPFDGLDAIVVNSAGCGSTMKEYGHILADDPAYAERAATFAAKVRDVCQYLDEIGWVAPLKSLPIAETLSDKTTSMNDAARWPSAGEEVVNDTNAPSPFQGEGWGEVPAMTIAYHDACHLAHGQQIREAPRRLLAMIPGIKLVPLSESEICCGSAGIYNLTEPDMARRLQDRKVDHILETGASIVATGNPGCLAWIESGLRQRGLTPLRVVHPVTLLAESLDVS